jgi:hypothetical protein
LGGGECDLTAKFAAHDEIGKRREEAELRTSWTRCFATMAVDLPLNGYSCFPFKTGESPPASLALPIPR